MDVLTAHVHCLAALELLLDVARARRVIAHLHDDELGIELLHCRFEGRKERIRCFPAGEELYWHCAPIIESDVNSEKRTSSEKYSEISMQYSGVFHFRCILHTTYWILLLCLLSPA